jgi:hypothetical protein
VGTPAKKTPYLLQIFGVTGLHNRWSLQGFRASLQKNVCGMVSISQNVLIYGCPENLKGQKGQSRPLPVGGRVAGLPNVGVVSEPLGGQHDADPRRSKPSGVIVHAVPSGLVLFDVDKNNPRFLIRVRGGAGCARTRLDQIRFYARANKRKKGEFIAN